LDCFDDDWSFTLSAQTTPEKVSEKKQLNELPL
jgi:hypothetical protein